MIRSSGLAAFVWLALLLPPAPGADPAQPAKTGDPALPSWLKLGAAVRGRAETFTGLGFVPSNNDGFYLHRLRLHASIEPAGWLTLFVQAQDAQAPGHREPVPSSTANTLDLRQGYAHIAAGSWALRFGRQELVYGEERLVGALNWGNVSRTFDALKLLHHRPGARLEWFASSVVVPVNGRFDRPRTANKFYGFYSSFDRLLADSVVEPYFFWKSETGDLDVYTYGVRAAGKLPRRFDYGLEMAFQSGTAASEDIRAWAGHWRAGFSPWKPEQAPRLVTEFNHASGDKDPGDGRRGTFDQLFPTNHAKYGIADRVGWRNMRNLMGGVEFKPADRWKINVDYHAFWLASRQDALYLAGGAAAVRNPQATSSRTADEIDFQADWRYSQRLQLSFGYARMFPKEFLKQSTPGGSLSFAYVMWNYSF